MKRIWFYLGLMAFAFANAAFGATFSGEKFDALKDADILIIRHAEKPEAGNGLSPAGQARADAYVKYFKNFTVDNQPLKLTYLFATADSKGSARPRLTLGPTSRALGLAIDARFKDKNFQDLVDEIESRPHGNRILIAWHHEKIPAILQALGADPVAVIGKVKWPENQYGWLIELRYNHDGQLVEAKRIDEKLMPDDAP